MIDTVFVANAAVFLLLYFAISYTAGHLAINRSLRVNYTRKINHFALFFIPLIVDAGLPYEITPERGMGRMALYLFCILVMLGPIRNSISPINVMFAGYD